jgi:hypothetical protein
LAGDPQSTGRSLPAPLRSPIPTRPARSGDRARR